MSTLRPIKSTQCFIGRLTHGCDLLEELTDICKKESITIGRIEGLGAVQKARLAYYNQSKGEYQFFTLDKHLEITKLIGNISIKDGEPMVHAHITLADDEGKAFGGHLAPGTIVFASEVIFEVFEGEELKRDFDEETGLPLWTMPV